MYPKAGAKAIATEMVEQSKKELVAWLGAIGNRAKIEKIDQIDVEVFCIPLPSAEDFRTAFLKAMGVKG